MTSPEYLTREDRRVMLQNIEGLQRRLSMVAHSLISDARDPLPGPARDSIDFAFIHLATVTKAWLN